MSVRNWKQVGPVSLGLVAGAAFLAGCGAQTGESAAAFQRMAADLAPLAQAKAQAALLQAPAAALAASAAAVPSLAATSAPLAAVLAPPAAAPVAAAPPQSSAPALASALPAGAPPAGAPSPLAGLPVAPVALATTAGPGLAAVAKAPTPEALPVAPVAVVAAAPAAPHPEVAPALASLLGLPAPAPNEKVLFAPGQAGEGVAWKALGRGAEALLGAAGYGAKRSAALSMSESLNLEGWQKPTLELKLAAGAGALRLVWASEGPLPEEHALGAKFLPGPDGLAATVELGEYATRPGRLILVAKGEEGQAPLRLVGLTLREAPQAKAHASLGQLASR